MPPIPFLSNGFKFEINLVFQSSDVFAAEKTINLVSEMEHVIDTTVVKHFSEGSSVNVTQDVVVLASLANRIATDQLREIRYFAGKNNYLPSKFCHQGYHPFY